MMEKKTVCGIDIGTTKVCVVIGQLDAERKVEVKGVGKVEFKDKKFKNLVSRSGILNPDFVSKFLTQALNEAKAQSGLQPTEYFVNLSTYQFQCLSKTTDITRDYLSDGEEVRLEDIRELYGNVSRTKIEGVTVLHVLPQEYSVDGENQEHYHIVGITGTQLRGRFKVITIPHKPMGTLLKSLHRAHINLPPQNIYLSPLATAMATLTDEEREHGVVLVDIGAGKTDMLLMQGELVRHVASFPVGGRTVTADIERGCDVAEGLAESLKIRYGTASHRQIQMNELVAVPNVLESLPPKDVSLKNVAVIIEARVRDIALFVAATIKQSGYERKIKTGIVLTGGGAKLEGINTTFQAITGLPVRTGQPEVGFNRQKADITSNPAFATVLGLLRLGFRALDNRDEMYEPISSSPIIETVSTPPPAAVQGRGSASPASPQRPRQPETRKPADGQPQPVEPENGHDDHQRGGGWNLGGLSDWYKSWYNAIFKDEFEPRQAPSERGKN